MKIEISKTELNIILYLLSEIKEGGDVLEIFDEEITKESFDNLYLKLNNQRRRENAI